MRRMGELLPSENGMVSRTSCTINRGSGKTRIKSKYLIVLLCHTWDWTPSPYFGAMTLICTRCSVLNRNWWLIQQLTICDYLTASGLFWAMWRKLLHENLDLFFKLFNTSNLSLVMIAQWDSSLTVLPLARVQSPTMAEYFKGFFPGWWYMLPCTQFREYQRAEWCPFGKKPLVSWRSWDDNGLVWITEKILIEDHRTSVLNINIHVYQRFVFI